MSKKVGILGRGFGLYGYLPAALKYSDSILIKKDYLPIFTQREELAKYRNRVITLDSDEEVLELAELLIIARNPRMQSEMILQKVGVLKQKSHVFLEKPVAQNLQIYRKCIEELKKEKVSYSVAYLFRFTTWFKKAYDRLMSKESHKFIVEWRIPLPGASWKTSNEEGGGLWTYYLIHFLSLLYEHGLSDDLEFSSSKDNAEIRSKNEEKIKIYAKFVPSQQAMFSVKVLSASKVEYDYVNYSPLGCKPLYGQEDPRIRFIEMYLGERILQGTDLEKEYEREDYLVKILAHVLRYSGTNLRRG